MVLWKKLLLVGFAVGAGLVVALATIFGGLYWYGQRPSPSKDWPDMKIESLNLNAKLKTKWRGSSVQFQFVVAPASDEGKAPFHESLSRGASHDGVTIQFYDSSGFKLCEVPVSDTDFSRTVDEKGKLVALDVNSSGYCSRGEYEDAEKWSLTWKTLPDAKPKIDISAGLVERPRPRKEAVPKPRIIEVPGVGAVEFPAEMSEEQVKQAVAELGQVQEARPAPSMDIKPPRQLERWRNRVNWRSLTKGMSREDVRRVLGEPNRIEGGSFEHWYYGPLGTSARVTFYSDVVSSWTEPSF